MRANFSTKVTLALMLLIFSFSTILITPLSVSAALSAEQKALYRKNILYYDLGCAEVADSVKAAGNIESVYMLGDSITEGAENNLTEEFKKKDINNVLINASVSRSITAAGITKDRTSGLQAIEDDKNKPGLKDADAIVVALGTNQMDSNFKKSVGDLINKAKEVNADAKIYWVNVFSPISGKGVVNETIREVASSNGAEVINTVNGNIEIALSDPLHVHPSPAGNKRFAEIVAGGIGTNNSTPDKSGGIDTLKDKRVYMVGDSITDAAKGVLAREFESKGAEAFINASGASSITYSGVGMSGLEAVEHDKNKVKNSDIIVIAHGTNHFPSDFQPAMKQMISKVKSYNDSAPILWVNTFTTADTHLGAESSNRDNPAYTAQGAAKKNEIISNQASGLGFTVIDVKSADIKTYDGIHPDPGSINGTDKYAKAVVGGISLPDEAQKAQKGCGCSTAAKTLSGNNNAEKIWNFFIENDYTPEQTAGFLGNFSVETGDTFDPTIVQGGGSSPEVIVDGVTGYGIAQWTYQARQQALKSFAESKGSPSGSLEVQLDFVIHELKGSPVRGQIKSTKTIEDAWRIISHEYENPAEPDNPKRGTEAQRYYNKFTGSGGGGGDSGGSEPDSNGLCGQGSGTSSGNFVWPVDKQYGVGSCWNEPRGSRGHGGLDILAPTGAPISAVDGGVVKVADQGDLGGFGKTVMIDHGNGFWSLYAHMKSIDVSLDDKVSQGQKIGEVNNTGSASKGEHLHFNLQKHGEPTSNASRTLNPLDHLPEDGRNMGACGSGPTGYK